MKWHGALRSWAPFVIAGGLFIGCAAPVTAQESRFPKGAQIFQANCMVCHQIKGVGLPGLAPPLTRNPGLYASLPEGRHHLAMMVLYGMFGKITVGEQSFDFKMPSFQSLSDDDLASVLNYVAFDIAQAPSSAVALTAVDIAAARQTPMTGDQVRQHRIEILKQLGL